MNADRAVTAVAAAVVGFAVAAPLIRLRLTTPRRTLMRVNVSGRPVPAVLGGPLAIAGLTALVCVVAAAMLGWTGARAYRMCAAVALLVVVMTAAGRVDDLRDEAERGFSGHLRAARRGRLTGGVVKLVAGAGAGAVAGAIVADGWSIVGVAATVALAANVVNLTDRAPGRAGKIVLVLVVPVAVLGPSAWTVAAAGLIGALVACLPHDLAERAMLGDAGANPLGAVVGLGLAASLSGGWLVAAVAVLVSLNLAAERWSFSQIIDSTPWLRALDRVGRRPE
jgi:UDP-GlcNAc:undecaprenyl-phosphate GlcNAc-1-phosphate transferase